jgi:tRNA A-37 threonylcarbamoyl transferase component Bud32
MGVVYKAQDPAIGRIIAIKSIRLSDLTDELERQRLRDRLFREAQSAGILSHPGIVTIYDFSEDGGLAYIFMEFVNGPPLENLLRSSTPPDRETLVGLLRQVAVALDYAHRKGIVHRDVKPSNIMVHEGTTAKVTDFGIAKLASQNMTQSGMIVGTPSYMSPEQIEGKAVDGKADQFSLAVVAYEALTGAKPFSADSLPTLFLRIVRDEPLKPTQMNRSLPAEINDVLSRAMAKNPADRFASCSDFMAALSQALRLSPNWVALPQADQTVMLPAGTDSTADHAMPVPPSPAERSAELTAARQRRTVRGFLTVAVTAAVFATAIILLVPRLVPRQAAAPAMSPAAEALPEPVEHKPQPAEPKAEPPATPLVAEPVPKVDVPALPQSASFTLTATPAGAAAVFDDDEEITCRTPCKVTLRAGRHSFVLRADGYREAVRIFNLPHDTGLIVNMEKSGGTFSLTTNPAGLTVILDGQAQLRQTPAAYSLATGPHTVELLKGTERKSFKIDIKDGVTLSQSVEWQ